MKRLLILSITGLIFFSCKKEKIYHSFNEKQLVFVNYSKGQNLKFIDTSLVVQTIQQFQFHRDFREQVGLYGKTGVLSEEYEVVYSPGNSDLDLHISLMAQVPVLDVTFASYRISQRLDSLNFTFPSITINGKSYSEVYTLKVYKNGQYINNNDTATLFHNKQFGVIQLLFPNGKKIIRTD
jgi:hypothetical protein